MAKDDMEIVSALQSLLVDKVGKERYSLWFAGTAQLRLESNTVIVAAADQFIIDRLRHLFRRDVEAATRDLLGSHSSVEFRFDPTSAPVSRESSQSSESVTVKVSAEDSADRGKSSCGRRRRFQSLNSFVVGDGNRLAFTAANGTAARLGSVTPLFLFGPTGCGKTHLLEAIWTAVRKQGRTRHVIMLSAEQFTSHFLEALHSTGLPSFRRKYRHLDLLLIDDVHFFAGKRATMVELQHTLDTLLNEGKQMVLAADRPPAELSGMGRELVARMAGGLVCGMEAADRPTRLGILRGIAKSRGLKVPGAVFDLLSTELPGDARQLSGALNRLKATSDALQRPITEDLARSALADLVHAVQHMVKLPDVERAVCEVFGVDPKSLKSSRKSQSVSQPRMLAMWLARKYTRAAYSEIGNYFGRRSHSTVISAHKKVNAWLSSNTDIQMAHGHCRIEDAIRRVEGKLHTA